MTQLSYCLYWATPWNQVIWQDIFATRDVLHLNVWFYLSTWCFLGVTVDCRHFVSTGCLGFLVVCLSSLDYYVREASSHTLSRFKVHLETSKFREKAQVSESCSVSNLTKLCCCLQISLLLEVLQNTIQELNAFLPSVFTSLVAKASRLFLQAGMCGKELCDMKYKCIGAV